MTLNVEFYQDTGPKVSNHGTTRVSVNNIGWKSNGLDETNSYVFYPINRSDTGDTHWCYTQYTYVKISGTYPAASRPKFYISGAIDGAAPDGHVGTNKVRLFYKLTNEYNPPSGNIDGSLIYLPPGVTQVLYPMMSDVGPEMATSYIQHCSGNTTYYTQYLVTQLLVEPGTKFDYGNVGELHVKFTIDEYESADI